MKEKLIRFLQGRYGNDDFNRFLVVIWIIGLVINIFIQNNMLNVFITLLWIYSLYRIMSRNIWKRQAENNTYLRITLPYRRRIKMIMMQFKDREHKYFMCPGCNQIQRVPRGKGKIEIRCVKCGLRFERKS